VYIDKENQLESIFTLTEENLIAIDFESRPKLSGYEKEIPVILQIGNSKQVFIVNLVLLGNSDKLSEVLS